MTALTTMFNFLIVYLRYFVVLIVGGKIYLADFSGEQYEIAKVIFEAYGASSSISSPGYPILVLFIGIIVIGAIIGLARRLIRG